jgi:hypothetical protein
MYTSTYPPKPPLTAGPAAIIGCEQVLCEKFRLFTLNETESEGNKHGTEFENKRAMTQSGSAVFKASRRTAGNLCSARVQSDL